MIRNAASQLHDLHIRFGLALAFFAILATGAIGHSSEAQETLSTITVPVEAAAEQVSKGADIAANVSSFLPGSFK